jgi:hypothetical protein
VISAFLRDEDHFFMLRPGRTRAATGLCLRFTTVPCKVRIETNPQVFFVFFFLKTSGTQLVAMQANARVKCFLPGGFHD